MKNEHIVGRIDLPALIEKLQKEIKKSINNSLSIHNINYPQYRILKTLSKNKKLHPSHVARELSIATPNITRQIQPLEKNNLISRIYDTNDRRLVWIQINQEGRDIAIAAGQSIQSCMDKFLKNIKNHDMVHFQRICISMLHENR